MATSNKALNDKIRASYLEKVKAFFSEAGEEVLVTGTNEICMPCVDSEGNEKWVQVVIKVPTSFTEDDDGYSRASKFIDDMEAKKTKAEEAAKRKAEKIEKDKAKRAAKKAKVEEKKTDE